jgi:tRNA threonylcarbamoyladenosine biosynthesis protein TsaB
MDIWLAIDTATDQAGVALHDGDKVVAESTWTSRRRHTVELGPKVEGILASAELEVDELAGLAVAIGPGSYTGLRIGLSFAKGLALGSRLPLVPVPTLDIVAAALSSPACEREVPLWAILSAGRGRLVAARYGIEPGDWPDPNALQVETVEDLAARAGAPAWVAGELTAECRATLRAVGLTVLPPAACLRRPGWLAELGRLRSGEWSTVDPDALAQIVPVYLGHGP